MLFTGLGQSVLGETVPSSSTQDLGHSFPQYEQLVNNIYVSHGWPIKSHLVMKGMQKVDKPLEGLNMFTHPQKIQSP